MTDIRPFRGVRYNPDQVKDLSSVISPPYDVISPQEQRLYHKESPYNIVRLEFGEDLPGDAAGDNKYTRAAGWLQSWLDEGVLFQESAPAYYVFEHRFVQQGMLISRLGLAGRIRLGDEIGSSARPHEVVMQSKVQDRLELLQHCQLNISPIMGLVRPSDYGMDALLGDVIRQAPDASVSDHQGVIHNMWVIGDQESITRISDWCKSKTIYIADGHHRYETAQLYRRERLAAGAATSEESFDFAMMTIMDAGDPGVVALPTHRLARLPAGLSLEEFNDRLAGMFHLEYLEFRTASDASRTDRWLSVLADRGGTGMYLGVYGLKRGGFCLLTIRDRQAIDRLLPEDKSPLWKELDVSVLHAVILHGLMGMDSPEMEEECLKYTRDGEKALESVDSGDYHIAFLVNPIPVTQILAVADAGDKMPPKSTYFFPKLPTGLVMYPLWD